MKQFFVLAFVTLISIGSFASQTRFTCKVMGQNLYFQYNGSDQVTAYDKTQSCDMKLDSEYNPTTLKGFLRFKPTAGDYCKAEFDPFFQTGRVTIDKSFLDSQTGKTVARLRLTGDGQTRDTKVFCRK